MSTALSTSYAQSGGRFRVVIFCFVFLGFLGPGTPPDRSGTLVDPTPTVAKTKDDNEHLLIVKYSVRWSFTPDSAKGTVLSMDEVFDSQTDMLIDRPSAAVCQDDAGDAHDGSDDDDGPVAVPREPQISKRRTEPGASGSQIVICGDFPEDGSLGGEDVTDETGLDVSGAARPDDLDKPREVSKRVERQISHHAGREAFDRSIMAKAVENPDASLEELAEDHFTTPVEGTILASPTRRDHPGFIAWSEAFEEGLKAWALRSLDRSLPLGGRSGLNMSIVEHPSPDGVDVSFVHWGNSTQDVDPRFGQIVHVCKDQFVTLVAARNPKVKFSKADVTIVINDTGCRGDRRLPKQLRLDAPASLLALQRRWRAGLRLASVGAVGPCGFCGDLEALDAGLGEAFACANCLMWFHSSCVGSMQPLDVPVEVPAEFPLRFRSALCTLCARALGCGGCGDGCTEPTSTSSSSTGFWQETGEGGRGTGDPSGTTRGPVRNHQSNLRPLWVPFGGGERGGGRASREGFGRERGVSTPSCRDFSPTWTPSCRLMSGLFPHMDPPHVGT